MSFQHSRPVIFGVAVGGVIAVVILSFASSWREPISNRRILLSDCDGEIHSLVVQYVPEAKEIALPVYRDFLPALDAGITVWVACSSMNAFNELRRSVGKVRCNLKPVVIEHPMTTWSRDRWIAFRSGGGVELLRPRGEMLAERWPERKGDEQIADDLAMIIPDVTARRSSLFFDGGDFVADSRTVFLTPRVAARNIQHTVEDQEELLQRLENLVAQRVVMLDIAPPHHAGMFMMPIGEKRMLVADPAAGRALMENAELSQTIMPSGIDQSEEIQQYCDAVAEQCTKQGYHVIRMPILPGRDGRTYMTALNAILDSRGKQRIVYMPIYQNAGPLNQAARRVWKSQGYDVRPVDCSSTYRHFGSLRCLVNVLNRR